MNVLGGEPQVIVVTDDDDDVRELIEFRLTREQSPRDGGPRHHDAEAQRLRGDPPASQRPELGRMPVLLLTASVQEGAATIRVRSMIARA